MNRRRVCGPAEGVARRELLAEQSAGNATRRWSGRAEHDRACRGRYASEIRRGPAGTLVCRSTLAKPVFLSTQTSALGTRGGKINAQHRNAIEPTPEKKTTRLQGPARRREHRFQVRLELPLIFELVDLLRVRGVVLSRLFGFPVLDGLAALLQVPSPVLPNPRARPRGS